MLPYNSAPKIVNFSVYLFQDIISKILTVDFE